MSEGNRARIRMFGWIVGLCVVLSWGATPAAGVSPAVGPKTEAGNASAGAGSGAPPGGVGDRRFEPMDVFDLEYASDPRISPDGERIVYVRNFMDVMGDRRRSNLWIVDADGSDHRPLTTGNVDHGSPRWSPDGDRLLYVARDEDGLPQLWVRWMDTGQEARLTQVTRAPRGISWSPDGRWIAFTMMVPKKEKPLAEMPTPPRGAEWAEPPRVIDEIQYRADGAGYLEDGNTHLFVVPAEGGTPRQLTFGDFDHDGPPSWDPDGEALVVSGNRHEDWRHDPLNSELYEVSLTDGEIAALTDRDGPDFAPVVSPDGSKIAYLGFDDRHQGYQITGLWVMERDGSDGRRLAETLDRSVRRPVWDADSRSLYVLYDDEGNGKIGRVGLDGEVETLVDDVGGTSIGRPYASGSFTVAEDGTVATVVTRPDRPADVAVAAGGVGDVRRLTGLNEDLFGHLELGEVEEIWFESSFDGRPVQGWIVKPPGFDPGQTYPLVLEIHGGPFANYGDRFSAEVQLYAADGNVVLYTNPRGSTSYGQEFGNLIHHAYPSRDYDDLMSGVDAVIDRGYVDPDRLYVTGGSGGGVLTAWIVGKTDRFAAAVVAKPVINWTSFVLTADLSKFFTTYWFPGYPWEFPEHYWERSPLSLVGEVSTPTMLLTGEADFRTPISETEQFYEALVLRKIDTAMVRIPGASHGIAARPSNLIAKVVHILEWFHLHPERDVDEP